MTIEDVRKRHAAAHPTPRCLCGLSCCRECQRDDEFAAHAHGDIAFLLRTLDAIAAVARDADPDNSAYSWHEVHALATWGKE